MSLPRSSLLVPARLLRPCCNHCHATSWASEGVEVRRKSEVMGGKEVEQQPEFEANL
jgi:hypothetical protein